MQKFYADQEGNYIGSFIDCDPPEGSIEVPQPSHGWQQWNGSEWINTPRLDALYKEPIFAQIDKLERSQLRAMRELAIGDKTAKQRLMDIDSQISTLRSLLG